MNQKQERNPIMKICKLSAVAVALVVAVVSQPAFGQTPSGLITLTEASSASLNVTYADSNGTTTTGSFTSAGDVWDLDGEFTSGRVLTDFYWAEPGKPNQ